MAVRYPVVILITIILLFVLLLAGMASADQPDAATIAKSDYLSRAATEGCSFIRLGEGDRLVWVANCTRPSPDNFRYQINATKRVVHGMDEYQFNDSRGVLHFFLPDLSRTEEDAYRKRHNLLPAYQIPPELMQNYTLKNGLTYLIQIKVPQENLPTIRALPNSSLKKALLGERAVTKLSVKEKQQLVSIYPGSITLPATILEKIARENKLEPTLTIDQRIALAKELGRRPRPTTIMDRDVVHQFGVQEPTSEELQDLRTSLEERDKNHRLVLQDWQVSDAELRLLFLPPFIEPAGLLQQRITTTAPIKEADARQ